MSIFIVDDICQTIRISLKNNALASQGSLQGKYSLSTQINGEKSWTSTTKAIWFHSEKNIWLIGRKEKRGGDVAGVYGSRILGSGPDDGNIIWNYSSKGWKKDTAKDIKVQCMDNAGTIFQELLYIFNPEAILDLETPLWK